MTPQAQFVERCVAAAADLALAFAHESDETVAASLAVTRANLAIKLTEPFGAEVAASFADRFVAAVAGHRREIEAAGAKSGSRRPC
jgi:hypothetical protein